ncbi:MULTISPECIES: hypothetical protein [unclassified Bradyrhizobium]|uniref:hypothetical protein n=1 Tax=unclassified Bradyrhizobium TaxID=2631580 RepID=UPI002916A0D0|nr:MULTISPECIES: hypothetical protein [unclassified Bradyrhizobium]
MSLALKLGLPARAALGSRGAVPAAPTLAMDPTWTSTQNTPKFAIESAITVVAGYKYRIQIQPTGGNWSSLTQDITHTITLAEDAADAFSFGFALLPNATYDARLAALTPGGSSSGWSNAVTFAVNLLAAPVNTVLPAISGDGGAAGNVLTVSTGSWTGTAPIAFTYQWKKGGVAITGATASTYTIQAGDAGGVLTVDVTGTNSQGNATATTASFTVGTVPANTAAPAIGGSSLVGSTLTASQGTWSGVPTAYAYQWKSNGTSIPGATAATYVTQVGDLGNSITCTVTASNGWGSASATSGGVTVVSSLVPTFVSVGSNTTSGTSFTFTGQNVGAAGPCVIAVLHGVNAADTTTAVSIGGVACTLVSGSAADSNGGAASSLWYCPNSPGGTQNVVVTLASTQGRAAIVVYTLNGAPGTIVGAANSGTGLTSISAAATIPSTGTAIVVANVHSTTAFSSAAASNDTIDNASQLATAGTSILAAHHNTPTGSQTMGFTWTGATDAALSIGVFAP